MFQIKKQLQIIAFLISSILFMPYSTFADYLFEDFSGSSLASEKWYGGEYHKHIANSELTMKLQLSGALEEFRRINLRSIVIGEPSLLSAKIKITTASLANNGVGSFGRVSSIFYSTLNTPQQGDLTGDVWASINIGDRGNGLESWWRILKSKDSEFSDQFETTGEVLAPNAVSIGTYYIVTVSYDIASTNFTFSIKEDALGSSTTTKVIATPYPRVSESPNDTPSIQAGVDLDNGGNGSESVAEVVFDNINFVGGGETMTDDFSSSVGYSNRWSERDYMGGAEVESGVLVIDTEANGEQRTYRRRKSLTADGAQCVKVDMKYSSQSNHPTTTRGRIRLNGYWYNDTNAVYTGQNRVVWGALSIEKKDGVFRAVANAWAEDDTLTDGGEDVFWHKFNSPVNVDTFYPSYIKLDKDNKKFIFSFNGEVYTHNITTPIHSIPNDEFRQLRTEIQGDSGTNASGYAVGEFDNLRVGEGCDSSGGHVISIDPQGSFLVQDPTDMVKAPTKVILEDYNIYPKDGVTVAVLGQFDAENGDVEESLIGVFVDKDGNKLSPGDASAVSSIVSSTTSPSGLTTDIAEDFGILPQTLRVNVPEEAYALWLMPNDSFFSDNTDPNGDYALRIRKVYDGSDGMCFPVKSSAGKVAVICL